MTNTPLQALALMNDPTYVEAARALAQRTLIEGGKDDSSRLTYAFRLATARKPTGAEAGVLRRLLRGRLDAFQKSPREAAKLIAIGEGRAHPIDPAAGVLDTGASGDSESRTKPSQT